MAKVPVFDPQMTEAVCNILAATDYPALSTSELESGLRLVKLTLDPDGSNKRTRLLFTLHNAQVRQKAGNALVVFINTAMHPSRYVDDDSRFNQLQGQLNERLALYGYRVNDEGKVAKATKASTLSEAAQLAGELVSELRRRDCHPALLTYVTRSWFGSRCSTPSRRQRSPSRTGCAGTRTWAPTAKTCTRRCLEARRVSRS